MVSTNFFSRAFAFIIVLISFLTLSGCNKQPIGPSGPDPIGAPDPRIYMPLNEFRALHTGAGDVLIPAGTRKIRGVVISNSINEAVGNYRIQDESGFGIYLYTVPGSPVYPQGAVLEIAPSGGGLLTLYNGDLELKNVPMSNVTVLGGGINITPRVATAAEVLASKNLWASSLVKLNNITSITESSSNSTGKTYTITDASGSLSMFVRTASGILFNTSGTSITGYVSIYNASTQIGIRTASDIQ